MNPIIRKEIETKTHLIAPPERPPQRLGADKERILPEAEPDGIAQDLVVFGPLQRRGAGLRQQGAVESDCFCRCISGFALLRGMGWG